MMKSTSLIAVLLSLYGINWKDFMTVCNLLVQAEYAAVYFVRNGNLYRVFIPYDDIPDTWMRVCVSSKNDEDFRIKLYIPADEQDALIDSMTAECLGRIDEYFIDYRPIDVFGKKQTKGNFIENKEVSGMIHNTLSTGILPIGPETYINRPANKHLSIFEGADYTIETYHENEEFARLYGVSVKGPDSTVYSLDSLSLFYRKNPGKVAMVCNMPFIETGCAILQAVKTYAENHGQDEKTGE